MTEVFERYSKISWAITIFGAVAIFYISSRTFDAPPGPSNLLTILYHILAFFSFNLFLLISSLKGKNSQNIFILAVAISVVYCILDELHQYFVPGRYCSVLDIGWDSIGILFSSMIYLILVRWKKMPLTSRTKALKDNFPF